MPRGLAALLAGVVLALTTSYAAARPAHADTKDVALHLTDPDQFVPLPIFDQMSAGDVLVVSVTGAEEHATGFVRQCRSTERGFTDCANHFPVQFNGNGVARFQYQLVDQGGCGPEGSCLIIVDVEGSALSAAGFVVFGASAPPTPIVTLTPEGPYEPGDAITVTLDGMVPGATSVVGFCGTSCRSRVTVAADDAGHATATVTVGGRCRDCGVRVVAGPHEIVRKVRFVSLPGPDHNPRRLAVWLLLAAALLLVAWRIGVVIDWRPPSEAATPELDRAVLTADD